MGGTDDQTLVDPQEKAAQHHLSAHEVKQPISFLNPTSATFKSANRSVPDLNWSSRDSRKNRCPPEYHHFAPGQSQDAALLPTAAPARMQMSKYKPHLVADCSFLVALIFTLGSAVWVINGFLLIIPLYYPTATASDANALTVSAAALAFIGGTLFEAGSYLMVVESLNTGHEEMWRGPLSGLLHWNRKSTPDKLEKGLQKVQLPPASAKLLTIDGFHFWGPPQWRDLGYLASLTQMVAATVFWVATVTGLPGVIGAGVYSVLGDVFFWTPQVVGGFGFVVSSLLLMIEVQRKWWLPNVTSIGWHIGFWNLVGALGFLLSGAFGYLSPEIPWENTQCVLTTFWGSWAFLIGSVMQLYETLWREPTVAPA